MSFFGKLLRGVGSFFTGLFDAARKAFKKLSPEAQSALIAGSGIIELINSNLDKSANDIRWLIATRYPELPLSKIESALFEVLHHLNIATDSTKLEDLISILKDYLKKLEGTDKWKTASHSAAVVLSTVLAPKETKFAAIVSLIEFVYKLLIKKQA